MAPEVSQSAEARTWRVSELSLPRSPGRGGGPPGAQIKCDARPWISGANFFVQQGRLGGRGVCVWGGGAEVLPVEARAPT